VPFDAFGPLSSWRLGLGARRDAVFAELEEHLASPAVRRAARLVEQHVVAALSPESVGRVMVVARRGPVPPPVVASPAAALSAPAFVDAILPLLHDDAVVRWLAFVDAEWLSAPGVGFDLIGFLRTLTAPAERRTELSALLRRQRRWWQPRLEEARLAEAASHRLAEATIAAVGTAIGHEIAGTLLVSVGQRVQHRDRPAARRGGSGVNPVVAKSMVFVSCGVTTAPLLRSPRGAPHAGRAGRGPGGAAARARARGGGLGSVGGSGPRRVAADRCDELCRGGASRARAGGRRAVRLCGPTVAWRRSCRPRPASSREQLLEQMLVMEYGRSLGASGRLAAVVVHEDVTPPVRGLLEAVRPFGVPSVHVPHGIYVKERLVGADPHGAFAHDGDRRRRGGAAGLVRGAWVAPERMVVTGNPAWDHLCGRPRSAYPPLALPSGPVVTFAASWVGRETPHHELIARQHARWTRAAFDAIALLRRRDPAVRLVVKHHPSAPPEVEAAVQGIAAEAGVTIDLALRGEAAPILGRQRVLIALPSTIVVESLLLGTPVVVPELDYEGDAVLTTEATGAAVAAAAARVLDGLGTERRVRGAPQRLPRALQRAVRRTGDRTRRRPRRGADRPHAPGGAAAARLRSAGDGVMLEAQYRSALGDLVHETPTLADPAGVRRLLVLRTVPAAQLGAVANALGERFPRAELTDRHRQPDPRRAAGGAGRRLPVRPLVRPRPHARRLVWCPGRRARLRPGRHPVTPTTMPSATRTSACSRRRWCAPPAWSCSARVGRA